MEEKTLIFLHSIQEFEYLNKIQQNFYAQKNVIFIAYDLDLRIYLRKIKIPFKIQEEFPSILTGKELDKCAFKISMNWHENLFKFQGISLGLLVQYDFFLYFCRILRRVHDLLKIFKNINPAKVIYVENEDYFIKEFNTILLYICKLNGVEIQKISFKLAQNPQKLPYLKNGSKIHFIFSKFNQIITNGIICPLLHDFFYFFNKLSKYNRRNVFITNLNYHSSLLKHINKNDNIYVMSLNLNINTSELIFNLKNLFKKNNRIFYLFLDRYKTAIIEKQTQTFFKILFKEWKTKIKKIKRNFQFLNISLWPIVKYRIYRIISGDFKPVIKKILLHQRLLKREKIDTLIVGNDAKFELRLLTILCNQEGIPIFVIQHGLLADVEDLIPSLASHYALWGKIAKNILINEGFNEKKLHITGSPRYDDYLLLNKNLYLKNKFKKKVKEDFSIQEDKKIILLTTTFGGLYLRLNSQNTLLDIEKSILLPMEAIKNKKDFHLIVKLHPGVPNLDIPYSIKENMGINNISITKDYDIVKLITACDCLITQYSSTILEALILEKPVICLKFDNVEFFTPILKYGAIRLASNLDELKRELKLVFNSPIPLEKYKILLKDFIYKLDSKSSMRVNLLINKVLNARKK